MKKQNRKRAANTRNPMRDNRGRFAREWTLKNKLMVLGAVIITGWLALQLDTMKTANNAEQLRLEQLREQVFWMTVEADALQDNAARASITIAEPREWLPVYQAEATAYSCEGLETEADILMNCPSKIKYPQGRTATGTTPKVGRTIACPHTLAGKTLDITGIGERVCEDTGGDITEGRVDIYMTDKDTANQYGRRLITYKIIN